MNVMSYKGYLARIEYSDEDACFIGHLAGIQDVIGFHGDSVAELKQSFNEAVDDYLATCKKLNRAAQKPYSGKMMLRIDPSIHAKAAMLAQAQGVSLNAWAQAALNQAIAAH